MVSNKDIKKIIMNQISGKVKRKKHLLMTISPTNRRAPVLYTVRNYDFYGTEYLKILKNKNEDDKNYFIEQNIVFLTT